jgi:hypothetical protein
VRFFLTLMLQIENSKLETRDPSPKITGPFVSGTLTFHGDVFFLHLQGSMMYLRCLILVALYAVRTMGISLQVVSRIDMTKRSEGDNMAL